MSQRVMKLAPQGLEIGEKVLWKYDETRHATTTRYKFPKKNVLVGIQNRENCPKSYDFSSLSHITTEKRHIDVFQSNEDIKIENGIFRVEVIWSAKFSQKIILLYKNAIYTSDLQSIIDRPTDQVAKNTCLPNSFRLFQL